MIDKLKLLLVFALLINLGSCGMENEKYNEVIDRECVVIAKSSNQRITMVKFKDGKVLTITPFFNFSDAIFETYEIGDTIKP